MQIVSPTKAARHAGPGSGLLRVPREAAAYSVGKHQLRAAQGQVTGRYGNKKMTRQCTILLNLYEREIEEHMALKRREWLIAYTRLP